MTKIFEGAKFGDKFVTRDGRMAVLIYIPICPNTEYYTITTEDCSFLHYYNNEGLIVFERRDFTKEDKDDIVGYWKEPIDEETLEDLSTNWNENYALHPHLFDDEPYTYQDVIDAFKYGYRKAKE